MIDLNGKVAVVTGGSRGIGRGIALKLAESHASVAVISRSEDGSAVVAREIESFGGKAKGYQCDVAAAGEVSNVVDAVVADFGSVDFLINNAGIVRDKLVLRMSKEDWDDVLSVNLTGGFNFVRALAPHFLKQRKGRIVNITSIVGQIGNAGQVNYAASKAGIIGMTRSLAKEFAPRGITVNAIAPGYITTDMTEELNEDTKKKLLEAIPLRRLGTAEDVASVVMFLLSGMADYVTGQVINCDGGMVMS